MICRSNLPARGLFIATVFLAQSSQALDSDALKAIEIQADTAQFYADENKIVYAGSVELQQGTLRISSQTLTLHRSSKGVDNIIATGQPARYTQQTETDKEPIKASAGQIDYNPHSEQLRLTHHAQLRQAANEFHGEYIEYDFKNKILRASSQPKTGTSTPPPATHNPANHTDSNQTEQGHTDNRVKMIISVPTPDNTQPASQPSTPSENTTSITPEPANPL